MIVLAVDKGQRDDPCPLSVSADDDVDPLAGLGVVDGDVAEGDRLGAVVGEDREALAGVMMSGRARQAQPVTIEDLGAGRVDPLTGE